MTARNQDRRLSRTALATLALLAVAGLLVSVYAGWYVMREAERNAHRQIEESIARHLSAAQDRLAARTTLAATAAALFAPPPASTPHALGHFAPPALKLDPDLSEVGWIPKVEKVAVGGVLAALGEAGVADPRLIGGGDQALDPDMPGEPLYLLTDLAPKAETPILGLDMGADAGQRAIIKAARTQRAPIRTATRPLLRAPSRQSIAVFAPVFAADNTFLGALFFGYEIERLLQPALAARPFERPTGVSVYDGNSSEPLLALAATETQDARSLSFERTLEFGGAPFRLVYSVPGEPAPDALRHGLLIGGTGSALTLALILLLGFAFRSPAPVEQPLPQISAEDRLKVLIHELNHRVRNVMSVVQAVVRLSFTSGVNLVDIQKTCEGRLQALANTMSLLTASDWKNVRLHSLISEEIIPFAARIEASGPDIAVKARAAQTFSLLLHELASNAGRHGALSIESGTAVLEWMVEGPTDARQFRLVWQEAGGPPVKPPVHRGFGELLLRRIAPRDVAGRATITYAETGLRYEIEAPLAELTDIAPRGRP